MDDSQLLQNFGEGHTSFLSRDWEGCTTVTRMMLGAKPTQVLWLMIRSGMSLAGIGVALGLVTSLALPKLVAARYNGFHASTAPALVAAPVVVAVAGFLACYIPARRAMRVDPMVAWRDE